MTRLPKILLNFLAVDYDIYMRRPALLAMAEAAVQHGVTVVAVNRPLCPFTTAVTKRHRVGELFGRSRLEPLAPNLYLFSPRYFVHDHIAGRLPLLQQINLSALRGAYRRLQERLNIYEPNPIIWYNYPEQAYVMNLFDDSFCVYELYDHLVNVEGQPLERSLKLQQAARERVDLLLTTSHNLQEQYRSGYRRSYMFGNGLARRAFDDLSDPTVKPRQSLLEIPSPRIGYAGVISRRLDFDLIASLAARRPDWNFLLVGPQKDNSAANSLSGLTNIHLVGPVDQADVPSVLKAFDIGFLPYTESEFFRYINPLKFYEMAASGLRQVASMTEELEQFPKELVKVVPNKIEAWERALADFIDQKESRATALGRQVAAAFIWEDMAVKLFSRLESYFAEDSAE